MATFTRINGYLGNFTTGTLFSTADYKAFLITVKDATNTAVNLQNEDGDGANEAGQIVERVVSELNPLMYISPSNTSGQIHVVMHGHNVDAAVIQRRLHQFLDANTTVALGTSITVA